ncbi:hypothetical protein [Chromobacterium subtsugae]|uniref:hypothetical protein n=1 Tax=Chromobacterium subtsugae TaxID=251747 RepID=UPI000640C971|nr:hypothetical protein [Chromobacterium subtsugae]
MRSLLTLFEHSHGISQKTGRPYSMANLQAHFPATDFSKEGYNREVRGYEPVPVEVNESAIDALKKMSFPCIADLVTDTKIVRLNGKATPVTIVTGVSNWQALVPQANPQSAAAKA